MPQRELRALWNELEAETGPLVGIVFKRVHVELPFGLLIAVDHPSKRRGIVFEAGTDSVPAKFRLPAVRGLIAETRLTERNGEDRVEITLFSRSLEENEIFSTVAADLAERLSTLTSQASLTRILNSRLASWARFFDRGGAEGLSAEAQRGLYAELWFLRHWLLPKMQPAAALAAWKGPEGASHDFQFAHSYVEVKSSASLPSARVEIANSRQLDALGLENLYLFVLQIDIGAAGESLAKAVELTRETVAQANPEVVYLLNDALIAVGYIDEHSHLYQATNFLIRRERVFRVEGNFPRIVDGDLRAGVGRVRYTLDLAACIPFEVDGSRILPELVGSAEYGDA